MNAVTKKKKSVQNFFIGGLFTLSFRLLSEEL